MKDESILVVHRESLRGTGDFLTFRCPVGKVADELRFEGRKARQAPVLCTGAFSLCPIFGIGLQDGIADAGSGSAGIHVALPVTARDDTAFPALYRPVEQRFRCRRIHFCKNQRGTPGPDRMAGGIGTLRSQPFIVLRENGTLVETRIRPHPEVIGLGAEPDLLDGRNAVHKHAINLRRLDRIDLHSKRYAVNGPHGVEAPYGIQLRLRKPLGVQPLCLAPHITHDVVRKRLPDRIGRSRQTMNQIRKLMLRHIQMDILCADSCRQQQDCQKDQQSFHTLSNY